MPYRALYVVTIRPLRAITIDIQTFQEEKFPLAAVIRSSVPILLLDDWWWLWNVSSEDVSLEEVRQPHFDLI